MSPIVYGTMYNFFDRPVKFNVDYTLTINLDYLGGGERGAWSPDLPL